MEIIYKYDDRIYPSKWVRILGNNPGFLPTLHYWPNSGGPEWKSFTLLSGTETMWVSSSVPEDMDFLLQRQSFFSPPILCHSRVCVAGHVCRTRNKSPFWRGASRNLLWFHPRVGPSDEDRDRDRAIRVARSVIPSRVAWASIHLSSNDRKTKIEMSYPNIIKDYFWL